MSTAPGARGSDDDDDILEASLFTEPSDYRQPPAPATHVTHQFASGEQVSLRLVGHNPLWGHYIWNGARVLSTYIEDHSDDFKGKTVLELGAGAGLPGITALLVGDAKEVVLTDYPDEDLIDNLRINVVTVQEAAKAKEKGTLSAKGYLWGDQDVNSLRTESAKAGPVPDGFDILLLADVNFNHHCHEALADSICLNLRRAEESRALVFFTPYRPWLLEKDMALFEVCEGKGLRVQKLFEEKVESLMFVDDPGDEELRKTVFGYEVGWSPLSD